MKTTIIPVSNKKNWNAIIQKAAFYDFYHCNSYNAIEDTGEPLLFVTENEEGDFIAFPIVIRSIAGSVYFDCTSVYGYPGPVASKAIADMSAVLISYFQQQFLEFLYDRKVVAAFSRLHPVFEQCLLLSQYGEIISLNKTVAIDLSLPLDIQRQRYRRSNKSEINQLRKGGYVVKKMDSKTEVDSFADIYIETMKRVNAIEHYFFSREYFHRFLSAEDFTAFLLLAYKEDQLTAGAVFTVTNNIMQYHLAGTKEQYMKATPMKLVLDEARLLGTKMGLRFLHLGGGVGGSNDDSLYRFKSGFSDIYFTYKVWRVIVDDIKYKELVAINLRERKLNTNYFPLYRG